jgi:uncharacterized membrane protein
MSYKTYRIIQAFNGMVLGAIMAVSISLGNWIMPLAAIIISISILTVLRRRVKEIVTDERTYAIAEKASRLTLQIVAIGMALVGVILLAISHDSSSTMGQTGLALCFATCGLLIINYLAYYYYSRKLGGK